MTNKQIKLAIVGCGPKALAIASKAYVLEKLGFGTFSIDIYEESGIAANWDGDNGFTDGEQPLGTAPDKDVGFPYQSSFGKAVDAEMLLFSWTSYLIDQGRFGEYIDRGKPHPKHSQWAEYLKWIFLRGPIRKFV